MVIATKLRAAMRPGPNANGLSRKAVMTEIDHSLRRLGTDYVDLYQIYRRNQATPWEETLEALHLQKANGWACFVSMQDS